MILAIAMTGCMSGPPVENPYLVANHYPAENPLFVPQGQDAQQYQRVYDTVYDVAHKYFDIAASNMYAGEILGVPRISAGIFDWITYEGYDASWDEWVPAKRLREPGAKEAPRRPGGRRGR